MIQSYLYQLPEKYTNPTVGMMFFQKTLEIDQKEYQLQIWDTGGLERFKAMTQLCFKDASGIILVCDVTDKSSLSGLRDWLKMIQESAPPGIGRRR